MLNISFAVSVKLKEVVLTFDAKSAEGQAFFCNPILTEVIVPKTVLVEIEWWVDDQLVFEEAFDLESRSMGKLDSSKWANGQEIRCMARAKHSIIGAKTEKKASKAISSGFQIITQDLELQEGGDIGILKIMSSVPISCPNKKSCCVDLNFEVESSFSTPSCPDGSPLPRLELPKCGAKICSQDWNKTISVPLRVPEDHFINGDDTVVVTVTAKDTDDLSMEVVELQRQTVKILASPPELTCRLSPNLSPTSGDVDVSSPGIFTVFRSKVEPVEVQVHLRSCSLSQLCTCAIAVRVDDMIVIFDVCTKGHLQAWAWAKGEGKKPVPPGFSVVSINEGREFRVRH